MAKSLCNLRKHLLEDKFERYVELVSCPQFVCTKCGRAANEGRNLCKPRPIGNGTEKKKKLLKKAVRLPISNPG
jgi:hypothetical protein